MNSFLSHFLSLLICTVIVIQLTSSASYPDPPPLPPPDASPHDWARFWNLLHGYYAIIARPRFGKRSELRMINSRPSFLYEILTSKPTSSLSSSENDIIYMLSGNSHNANQDGQMSTDDINTLIYPVRRRR
ncbi:hypothetical protein I4U23_003094 [Adineta vaga]|nr:hypothetical protein I4U23_003094 [Adineta vaga]